MNRYLLLCDFLDGKTIADLAATREREESTVRRNLTKVARYMAQRLSSGEIKVDRFSDIAKLKGMQPQILAHNQMIEDERQAQQEWIARFRLEFRGLKKHAASNLWDSGIGTKAELIALLKGNMKEREERVGRKTMDICASWLAKNGIAVEA